MTSRKYLYIYRGEPITRQRFLSICRQAGFTQPARVSMFKQLQLLAAKGSARAQALLHDLVIIPLPSNH